MVEFLLVGNLSASQVHNSDRSVTEMFFNAALSILPPKNSRYPHMFAQVFIHWRALSDLNV